MDWDRSGGIGQDSECGETILRQHPEVFAKERATGTPTIVLAGFSLGELVPSTGDGAEAESELRMIE